MTLKIATSSVGLSEDDGEDGPEMVDWHRALIAGGFDPNSLTTEEPSTLPPYYAEERKAWIAETVGKADRRMHVEAAAFNGRVVFFDARPVDPPELPGQAWGEVYDSIQPFLYLLLFPLLPVAGIFLARRHYSQGRGDVVGARHLFGVVVTAQAAVWILAADHVAILGVELTRVLFHLGRILLEALMVWAAYMAFEPIVRRFWHEPLVSWSRIIRGRLRDPLVGRSLLVGSILGAFWAFLGCLDRVLGRHLGLEPMPEMTVHHQLENVLSMRQFFATMIEQSMGALYLGIFDLCFLVLLRLFWRRPLPAVLTLATVNALWYTMDGWNPGLSWLTLGVGIAGTGVVLLVRQGLVAYITALFVQALLGSIPVTLHSSAWFAGSGAAALLLVVGIGAFGFHQAMDGRSWTGEWLDSAEPQLSN